MNLTISRPSRGSIFRTTEPGTAVPGYFHTSLPGLKCEINHAKHILGLRLGFGCVLIWATLQLTCLADPPAVEHIFPSGFTRGATIQASLGGKFETWPLQVWVSCPGVSLTTETNKGQVRVTVAPQAPLGAHLLRFYNADGSSAPRIFIITDKPEILEAEPNDQFSRPQFIDSMPVTVNGRLAKAGDVDSFAVHLKAGQWLEARVDAYVLASKMDALLRLVTLDGVELAWNHDFDCLDPRLCWQAPSDGTYVVQIMGFKYPADAEVRLTGGDGCVYRLHLQTLAKAPALVHGGELEHEPNNSLTNALVYSLPATIRGAIVQPGDEDWFGFNLEKDQVVDVKVAAASLGSPLTAWLKLTDAQGKELARNEDNGQFRDPNLEWRANAPGAYFVAVGNLLNKGGPDFEYRLSMSRVVADYRASLNASSFTLQPGETNEIKFQLTRVNGFDHKLIAGLYGLPAGTHAQAVELPKSSAEATIKLVSDADAKPAQLPVRIGILDSLTSEQRWVPASLISSSEDNGVPGGYTKLLVEETDQLWLTVKAKPAGKK